MFSTAFGLPLHPLVVHASVVLIPLAAILLIAAAWSPSVRRRAGLLTPALAVVAAVLVPITTQSGESLEHQVPENATLETHTHLGDQLLPFVLGLAAVALVLAWVTRSERRSTEVVRGTVILVVGALAVLVGAATVVQVVRIGHSGAQAAWSDVMTGTPSQGADSSPEGATDN